MPPPRPGPGPCCTASRQHPRQRPAAGAAPDSGPQPRRTPVRCLPVPLSPALSLLSRCPDTPLPRRSSVPLSWPRHRRLGRPPALRGASPKLLPPARRCCRAVPGCTRTVAHTHTRTARTHTPAHSHTPPGARSPPRHAPPRAGSRSFPPTGGQGCRGRGAARPRAARGAGGAPEEGDAPRGAAVLAARPHPQAGRAARTGSRGQPRCPGSPVPSACPACPTAEPRGPLGGSPLRRTWPGEAVAPCLLGAGIGGSPAAPSWRAGGGETAVGWARVPSVFSTAPPQGKKQVIPGSSIISYRRISHFLPLLNFFRLLSCKRVRKHHPEHAAAAEEVLALTSRGS